MIEEKEELQGQLIASGQIVGGLIGCKGEKGDKGDTGNSATITVGTVTTGSPGTQATVTNVGTPTDAIFDFVIPRGQDGSGGGGGGDMYKSTYDKNDNGIVDNAEKVNNHTVLSDVPADAVFTDTTYTAGTGIDITAGVISNTQTSAEWGNISGDIDDQTDLQNILDDKVNSSDLSTVATSGSYNDLSNKPTIPTKVSDLTNDSGFINKNVNDLTNYTTTSVINTLLAGKENDIPVQDTAPANPRDDDLWIDTSDNTMSGVNVLNEYSTSNQDTYSCDYINDLTNKQPQYCHATSTGTQTPTSNYYVSLSQFDRKQGNFTFENGGVKIGSGINTVQVSGSVFIDGWNGRNSVDYVWGRIYKNNNLMSGAINSTNSPYISCPIPAIIMPVNEGDIIKLMADNSNNDTSGTTIRNGGENTYLDIFVIN